MAKKSVTKPELKQEEVKIRPIQKRRMSFGIVGTSPLIMHQWSEKAKRQMREKQAGKKTKTREKRDPEGEAEAATYRTEDGRIGIPGMAFKKSLLNAAHRDLGIEKTLVRKAIFLITNDAEKVLPIRCSEPEIREDMVRVSVGSTDLRYRPMFTEWSCEIELEVDAELVTKEDIITLVERAGFGVGICEMRPEKGGEYGRFDIDQNIPVHMES